MSTSTVLRIALFLLIQHPYLDARVDLDEVVVPRLWVHQELDRASVDVARALADAHLQ